MSTTLPPSTPHTLKPTRILAVQVLSFLCSIGTGLVTNGVYYLTKNAYGFTRDQNLWLACAGGITYILAAFFAGKLVRAIRSRFPAISSRTILIVMMIVMAAMCLLPVITGASHGAEAGSGGVSGGVWVMWTLVLGYTPLTGILWPMVESFISGGRSGAVLRSAIGAWNGVWAGALVVSYLALSSVVERHPSHAFIALAAVHLVSALWLLTFERDPAPHIEGAHDPHPPVYEQLLVVFRILLPMAYFVLSAMNPILPDLMASMGVAPTWQPIVGIAWLAPRAVMFVIMGRWDRWHGTWGCPIVGTIGLIAGFSLTVVSPLIGSSAGVAMMVAGLATFGVSMAVIYSGAIYYALEVGKAEVDAGGVHEALIGVGYTTGPACGLAASAAITAGVLRANWFELAVLSVVGAIAVAIATYAIRHARHMTRHKKVP